MHGVDLLHLACVAWSVCPVTVSQTESDSLNTPSPHCVPPTATFPSVHEIKTRPSPYYQLIPSDQSIL